MCLSSGLRRSYNNVGIVLIIMHHCYSFSSFIYCTKSPGLKKGVHDLCKQFL